MKWLFFTIIFAFGFLSAPAQWTQLNSNTNVTLNDIFFTDASTGYAGGVGGVLVKTINGGATWTPLPIFTSKKIIEIYFTDAATGWVNLEQGGLFRTTNGGQTFEDMLPLFGSLPAGSTIHATSMNFNGPVAIVGISFSTQSSVLFFWRKTTNGGQTWTSFTPPVQYPYASTVRILNADTLFVADYGQLLRTFNGGNTWDTLCQCYPSPLNNKCLKIFDALGNGVVSLPNYVFGVLEPVANGGVTISQRTEPNGSFVYGVNAMSFPEGKTGYLLKSGFINTLRYEYLLKTKDGGTSFVEIAIPDSFSTQNLHFVTEAIGYTCGQNGAIYKTTNGGGTLAILDPSKAEANILIFPNPATEWFTIPHSALPFQKAELFSADGKKVKTIAAGTTTVDVRGLPTGHYLLLLQKGNTTQTLRVAVVGQ